MNRSPGFGYLFERFPSFTQTFCAREILEWEKLGYDFPVFSIRSVEKEAVHHFSDALYERTTVVPDVEALAARWWTPFSFRSRKIKRVLREEWGADASRRRALEAAWLGPRLRAAGVSHVHVHFAGLAARTAFWLNRCFGITYSFTAHANDFFVRASGQFLEELFAEARFVVTVSDFSADELRQRFPVAAQKIHRVYNGIDTEKFALPRAPVTPPSIISIGRCIEKKGFPDLIRACGLLREREFVCRIVGEGPMEAELRDLIRNEGLEKKVLLVGPKSEEEIRHLLAESSIFALACCREKDGGMDNLPTVIMEAMAAGLPVLSTRLAGVPEMIDMEKTGLLVEEHDVPGFAAALGKLLNAPAQAAEMGEAGRQLARERFDLRVTSRQLEELFQRYGVLPGNDA